MMRSLNPSTEPATGQTMYVKPPPSAAHNLTGLYLGSVSYAYNYFYYLYLDARLYYVIFSLQCLESLWNIRIMSVV